MNEKKKYTVRMIRSVETIVDVLAENETQAGLVAFGAFIASDDVLEIEWENNEIGRTVVDTREVKIGGKV